MTSTMQLLSNMNEQPHKFLIQINFDLLKFIANTLTQLCYLKLNVQSVRLLHTPTFLTQFTSSLKTLIVETAEVNQIIQLNFWCDELVCLEITVHVPIQDYKLFSEFVCRFKSIKSLSIGFHPVTLDDDFFVRMMKSLANLQTLAISSYKNQFLNDLCFIINTFDRIHTVRIDCFDVAPDDRDAFINSINGNYFLNNNNWKGSCVLNEFELKKY